MPSLPTYRFSGVLNKSVPAANGSKVRRGMLAGGIGNLKNSLFGQQSNQKK